MNKPLELNTIQDIKEVARMFAESKLFKDATAPSQAFVKIMAGHELGFGPFASMSGVHMVQGKPTVGANLMAASVKRHPRYDYRVVELSDEICRIAFYEIIDGARVELGVSKFDLSDAKRANTTNLGKYPRNMLFARAISNGVRFYCPDVFDGASVYTPDELGAQTNDDGSVVATQDDNPPYSVSGDEATTNDSSNETTQASEARNEERFNSSDAAQMHATLTERYGEHITNNEHYPLAARVLGREVTTFNGMSRADAKRVMGAARKLATARSEDEDVSLEDVIKAA